MRTQVGIGHALAVAVTGALAVGGCSLLFDGHDLKGRNGGDNDMAAGGSGGGGGGGGGDDMAGAGGTGGTGGGGGTTSSCTPKTTVHFNVTHPSVAAASPHYMTAGDINGDGKLDLVTSNYGASSFSVMLGDGNGGFTLAATTPITTCAWPFEPLARDVTGDGKLDLIVTCWDGSAAAVVNVHVNTSTTTTVSFATPKPVTLPAQAYYFPVVGKFASTATHPGLALVGNNHIYLYTGAGDGSFAAAGNIPAGMGADAAAIGDLNGDGLDDFIAYNYDDNDFTMALSHAGSAYTTSPLALDNGDMGAGGLLYFGGTPMLVDYDGDGVLDLVNSSGTSQNGYTYLYKNMGTKTAPSFPLNANEVGVGDLPLSAVMADMNCDGKLDIVAASNGCAAAGQSCSGGPNVWVLTAHGTGFDAPQATTIEPYCDNLIVADFNADGYPDIACGGGSTTANSFNLLLSAP
jgi:hypothetical protein